MINTLKEVEEALERLINLETEQQKLQFLCRKKTRPWYDKISQILLEAQEKEEVLLEEAVQLQEELENFARKSKDCWTKKSLKMLHGTIGFREKVQIEVSEKTAQSLLNLGYHDYVRMTMSPERKRMLQLDDNILKRVGAKKIVHDQFYVSTIPHGG